jgi:hypothetical protein
MTFPNHYLAIKPIFDLCLFGIDNVEEYFATNQKLRFSNEFLFYQKEFLSKDDYGDNVLLLQTCFSYLSNVTVRTREDVVKVITDNQPLAEALVVLLMLNSGLADTQQAAKKFQQDLIAFIKEKTINESILLFFQQHFLNFERIDITSYQNFELNRSEYLLLVSDYLKIQSKIF